tara:strand:+ start:383 stop:787 length:405 start_codon:yes stop_codon:yes gene_type:complete
VIRKLNQLVGLILATKLMTWAVPDTKKFIKGILITGIIILITIYLHSEYLSWSEISGNSKFITSSYIIKNLIILVSLISLYLYLRKPSKKIYPKVKGEEKIYTKNTNEDYFDKFRNKEKLKTKAEQILEKDGKD